MEQSLVDGRRKAMIHNQKLCLIRWMNLKISAIRSFERPVTFALRQCTTFQKTSTSSNTAVRTLNIIRHVRLM